MSLTEKMNVYLANQQISFIKLHNLHWYVQGSAFFTLHAKFEELYDHTADVIDDVAERLLAMGQSPIANLKQALSVATIKELESVAISSDAAIKHLTTDVEYWVKDTKEIISLAEEQNDVVTADLFTGYLNHYEKLAWMLKAYQA
ncbi:Dps family protein [Clostridium minihomine]|uniref:Dps family protein n=1 Tax=Clostridium minihomine TaxID=2045012 RepID=UPI000C775D75|nr:DNA starvation/stationary phase protection protein [Clostridium minihomine]